MLLSEEIKNLLDLSSKITGSSYYLCDLNNMIYLSTPNYKSQEKLPLSRDFLSIILNKSAKLITSEEKTITFKDNKQIKLYEESINKSLSNFQIVTFIELDDELIGVLVSSHETKKTEESSIEFNEKLLYFIQKCLLFSLTNTITENEKTIE